MPVDIFMKIDGIKGEAQDKKHKDEIDVLSWNWGMTNSGTTHVGGGSGSGKVNVRDIVFTKYIDSSTPALMHHCCNGKHIANATLVVRKSAGENALEYIIIKFSDMLITSVSNGGEATLDRLTESVTINFAKVDFEYFVQDAKGIGKSAGKLKWNIPQNATF